MPHELTWTDTLNVTYSPADTLDATRYHLWWLCSALIGGTAWAGAPVGGRWTLFGSSDGAGNAGLDTTDRLQLNGAYNGNLWVRANAGSNHTWVCLRSPIINGSRWYMIIDFNTAQDYQVNWYWSKAAPTGGTATARPTATDEWQTPIGGVCTVMYSAQNNTGMRLSLGMSSGGNWWHNQNRVGVAYHEFFAAFCGTVGYHASDNYPIVAYTLSGNSANAIVGGTLLNVGSNYVRRWDGGAANSSLVCYAASNQGVATQDALFNTFPYFPLNVFCYHSSTSQAYRGRVRDFFVLPSSASPAQGNTVSEAAVVLWAVTGQLLVPASAALICA